MKIFHPAVGSRTHVIDANSDRTTFSYDATNQLTCENSVGATSYIITHTYDLRGNRTRQEVDGLITTYTYNNANQLVSEFDITNRTTYTYDRSGNQLSTESPSLDLTTYTWDYENRQTRVELPSGDIHTYAYNSDHKQIAKEDELGVITSFTWDHENIIEESNDTGVIEKEYTYKPTQYGDLISQYNVPELEPIYHHYNAQGSTTELTDETEVITDTWTYQSFGKQNTRTGTTINPYQWIGKKGYYKDEETKSYSIRRRTYNPISGRFQSEDPIGFAGGDVNWYRYVKNDPTGKDDPSGLGERYYLELFPIRQGGKILKDQYWVYQYREVKEGPWYWKSYTHSKICKIGSYNASSGMVYRNGINKGYSNVRDFGTFYGAPNYTVFRIWGDVDWDKYFGGAKAVGPAEYRTKQIASLKSAVPMTFALCTHVGKHTAIQLGAGKAVSVVVAGGKLVVWQGGKIIGEISEATLDKLAKSNKFTINTSTRAQIAKEWENAMNTLSLPSGTPTCGRQWKAYYSKKSRSHCWTHGHSANAPKIAGKSRFIPREGGQSFTDEVLNHPSAIRTVQSNGRIAFMVTDLGRTVGRDRTGNLTRGGMVIVEGPNPASWSIYSPGEVVTQYPY